MKNLKKYSIFESIHWYDDLIKDYDFDTEYIKEIFQDIIDEGMSVNIQPYFMNRDFIFISKKIDALESNFYCGYSIDITNILFPTDIDGFIKTNNLIFNSLRILESNFKCKVNTYIGRDIRILCLDLSQPFDTRSIDIKGNKANKIRFIKMNRVEQILSQLEIHSKIMDTKTLSSNLIEITPKINISKVEEILNKIFYRNKEFLNIYQKDNKIIIKTL